MNAAETFMYDNTIDCLFSVTVLEHISPRVTQDIILEAKRIVTPTGSFIHYVDMSDPFQHTDKCNTPINFLQDSESKWTGNSEE